MATVHMWVGGVLEDEARVVAKVTGTSAELVVSTSPDLSSPQHIGPVTPVNGIVRFHITGLTPNTRYYYAVETDGVLDTSLVGRFKTHPPVGEPASFKIVSSGCAGQNPEYPASTPNVSNHPVFDIIRGIDPLFFSHLGDLHYRNISTNDVDAFRQAYDDVLAAPRQHQLYREVPLVYVWDDHDFGPNDSDGTSPSRPAAAQVYRERVPSYELPAGTGPDAPIYHSFEVGRILFIVSDTRWARTPKNDPDGPNKTMLGAQQKAWMESVLSTSSASALVWLNPTPWMGLSSDTWNGYKTERDELVQLFGDYGWLDRMVCINADYHGLGMDTGGGNHWGGFPVYVWCSLDSPASGAGSTQYDMGPTELGNNHYGILEINDDGNLITLTGTGYVGETVWRTHTKYIPTSVQQTPERAVTLTYDHTLSRVRVTSSEVAPVDLFADTFTRNVTGGWGTSDSGHTWSVAGANVNNFLTTLGVGRVVHSTVGTRLFTYTDASWSDVDLVGQITAPPLPSGAAIQAGYMLRANAGNDFYCAMLNFGTDGQVHADIQKRVGGGSITTLGSTTDQSFSPGARKWVRFRAVGPSLSVKLWDDGQTEPTGWGFSTTDTALTEGSIGTHSVLLSGNTNTRPVNIHFDNITMLDPPPVTIDIERSVDEVTWKPVRGGAGREVAYGETLTVDDYEFAANVPNHYRVTVTNAAGVVADVKTVTTTPILQSVWLKNVPRPFLNRPVKLVSVSDIQQQGRVGVFNVVGRSYPVTVTDLAESRRFSITVMTETVEEGEDLEGALTAGDVVFIHVPPTCPLYLPTMYGVITDVSSEQAGRYAPVRLFTVELTETAEPPPSVVPVTITWVGTTNLYRTWDETEGNNVTWSELVDRIGKPRDVIVL